MVAFMSGFVLNLIFTSTFIRGLIFFSNVFKPTIAGSQYLIILNIHIPETRCFIEFRLLRPFSDSIHVLKAGELKLI